MNIEDIANNKMKNLKTYKKNLKFIEKFDGIDNVSNLYQKVESNENIENNNLYSEDSCLPSIPIIKSKNEEKEVEEIVENFQVSDNKDAGKAVEGLKTAAVGASNIANQMKSKMASVIGTAIETLQKPEFKEKVKEQVDSYAGIVVDSVSRTLADPSHQHKVDEYIVKPFWDLYIIPFIDMYVIFLILYYIIFIVTMIWVRKNT